MIDDIYKVGPLTYLKIFRCDYGSEFKEEVPRLLRKHEFKIWMVRTKYGHMYTHTAFVKARNKVLAEQLFKVQDAKSWMVLKKYHRLGLVYGLLERLSDTKTHI